MASSTLKKIEKKLDTLINTREKIENKYSLIKEKLDTKYQENLEKLNTTYREKTDEYTKKLEEELSEITPEITYLRKQVSAIQKLEKSIAAIDEEFERRENGEKDMSENKDEMMVNETYATDYYFPTNETYSLE